MSHEAALDILVARQQALVAALDRNDLSAIEHALFAQNQALADVVAQPGWRGQQRLEPLVRQALGLAEDARLRVNFLTQMAHRRLDALASAHGAAVTPRYRRDGRMAPA